jgi:hypothetical protein
MKLWKIQKFFGDIVYDLRQRGLLPVAALMLVALVAVPVLISRSGSSESGPMAAPDTEALSIPENQSAVLAYNPGVRNYKRRLDALQAKDPFQQQFTGGAEAASVGGDEFVTTIGGGGAAASSGSATVGGSSSDSIGSGGSGGSDESGGDVGGGGQHRSPNVVIKTKYLSYKMDVAFGEVGSMTLRRNVEPLSFLPSEQVPVLVFLGIGGDGSKAMFLVSSDVPDASGQGTCIPSSSSPCYLLVMKTGEVEDFTYGPNGKTYRLKLTAIRQSSAG